MITPNCRIGGFEGTDAEYIAFLEAIVLRSNTVLPSTPPPNSHSDGERTFESAGSSLEFVPYEHNPTERPLKRVRLSNNHQPRWMQEIDDMIADMSSKDYVSKRKTVGLLSPLDIIAALDLLIGIKDIDSFADANAQVSVDNPSSLLKLLQRFAKCTASFRRSLTFKTQVCHFKELVFVSMCCVALQEGEDRLGVDLVMRQCVSDSSEKNLARLRKAALWVNRAMAKLARAGLGHLAYEIFMLCRSC